jgi:hypothetical protein
MPSIPSRRVNNECWRHLTRHQSLDLGETFATQSDFMLSRSLLYVSVPYNLTSEDSATFDYPVPDCSCVDHPLNFAEPSVTRPLPSNQQATSSEDSPPRLTNSDSQYLRKALVKNFPYSIRLKIIDLKNPLRSCYRKFSIRMKSVCLFNLYINYHYQLISRVLDLAGTAVRSFILI